MSALGFVLGRSSPIERPFQCLKPCDFVVVWLLGFLNYSSTSRQTDKNSSKHWNHSLWLKFLSILTVGYSYGVKLCSNPTPENEPGPTILSPSLSLTLSLSGFQNECFDWDTIHFSCYLILFFSPFVWLKKEIISENKTNSLEIGEQSIYYCKFNWISGEKFLLIL